MLYKMMFFRQFAILVTLYVVTIFGDDEVCQSQDNCKEKDNKLKSTIKTWESVKADFDRIKEACGELCDTTMTGVPGKYYEFIHKEIDCRNLFENSNLDGKSEFASPPARIPKYLRDYFTHSGKFELKQEYFDDGGINVRRSQWTLDQMEWHFESLKQGKLSGSYGMSAVREVSNTLKNIMDVVGKNALVIGSVSPWLETLILDAGVAHVTTTDYWPIVTEHPQMSYISPKDLSDGYLNGTITGYDIIVSFSSVEHSGLGRYGDALNPWGDLIAMGRAYCLLKPGAQALIGVPTGPDRLVFNAARLYGPKMYPHLFANWKQIHTLSDERKFTENCPYCYQPVHVLERPLDNIP